MRDFPKHLPHYQLEMKIEGQKTCPLKGREQRETDLEWESEYLERRDPNIVENKKVGR